MDALIETLQNPNVAFLLLIIGGLALATELVHPNLLTGILGRGVARARGASASRGCR